MNDRRQNDAAISGLRQDLADHGQEARDGHATVMESIRVEHAELRASLKTLADTVKDLGILASTTDRDFRQALWFARGAFAVVTVSLGFMGWILAEKNAQIQTTQKAVIEAVSILATLKDELRRQDEVDRALAQQILRMMERPR